jgi:hypothetical protein
MDYLRKWGEGVPAAINIVALQLASQVWAWSFFLGYVKDNRKFEAFGPMVDTQEWLGLYRNHRRMFEGLVKGFTQLGENWAEGVRQFQSSLQQLKQLKKVDRGRPRREISALVPEKGNKESEQLHKTLATIYELQLAHTKSLLQRKFDENMMRKLMEVARTPEIEFVTRIWIVCFMYYGKYPGKIMRKARHGDLESIEKLLRLDKSLLGDPMIREYIRRYSSEKDKSRLKMLSKALGDSVKRIKVTPRSVKYKMGGMLSYFSMRVGHPLTELQIRELFDAVVREAGEGEIDTDLPESLEAFCKAIKRERRFWIGQLGPDKK